MEHWSQWLAGSVKLEWVAVIGALGWLTGMWCLVLRFDRTRDRLACLAHDVVNESFLAVIFVAVFAVAIQLAVYLPRLTGSGTAIAPEAGIEARLVPALERLNAQQALTPESAAALISRFFEGARLIQLDLIVRSIGKKIYCQPFGEGIHCDVQALEGE